MIACCGGELWNPDKPEFRKLASAGVPGCPHLCILQLIVLLTEGEDTSSSLLLRSGYNFPC